MNFLILQFFDLLVNENMQPTLEIVTIWRLNHFHDLASSKINSTPDTCWTSSHLRRNFWAHSTYFDMFFNNNALRPDIRHFLKISNNRDTNAGPQILMQTIQNKSELIQLRQFHTWFVSWLCYTLVPNTVGP